MRIIGIFDKLGLKTPPLPDDIEAAVHTIVEYARQGQTPEEREDRLSDIVTRFVRESAKLQ